MLDEVAIEYGFGRVDPCTTLFSYLQENLEFVKKYESLVENVEKTAKWYLYVFIPNNEFRQLTKMGTRFDVYEDKLVNLELILHNLIYSLTH